MIDLSKEHVTIAAFPADMPPMDRPRLRDKAYANHAEKADELVILVPPGRWREVRTAIWEALGTGPAEPENVGPHGAQDGDYIRRAYGSL